MFINLLMAVHVLSIHVFTLLSVDEILLSRHINWSIALYNHVIKVLNITKIPRIEVMKVYFHFNNLQFD